MTTRRDLLAAGAAISLLGAGRASAQLPSLDAALAGTLAAGDLPALAGMIVGPDTVLWTGASGVRRKGGIEEATVEDRWHLGSNTKAMTAALYGRLVDQGRATWGARIADLLPVPALAPEWREVTIEALLSHTAGLSDATAMGQAWLMTARDDPRSLTEQRAALAQAMLATAPAGPAGTFAYANANYVLVGAVIERITGLSWESAIMAEVFEPLGITSGGFGAPLGDQPWGHRGGVGIDPTSPASDNPLAMGPAATVSMTLSDYARFLRALMATGDGWLTSKTRAVLTRALGSGAPAYGGGWLIVEGQPWARGPALTHDGSNTMWYVSAWLAPAIGRAFVAVSNDGAGAASCQRLIGQMIASG